MSKKISTGVYAGAEADLYEEALDKWGWEAQALQTIQELNEFSAEITRRLQGKMKQSHYLGELIDAQIMINQMVHNELNNPHYWMIRKQKIERLKLRLGS